MNIEEIERRMATVGIALLPHQRRAVESSADITILEGSIGSGKTFTVLPWALSLDPTTLHAIIAETIPCAIQGILPGLVRGLELLGIEHEYGRRPPASWGGSAKVASHREAFTIRDGATIIVASLRQVHQLRGVRLDSIFIDIGQFDEPQDEISFAIQRANRAIVTTYNGEATRDALRRNGVQQTATIVNARTIVPGRSVVGERVANA